MCDLGGRATMAGRKIIFAVFLVFILVPALFEVQWNPRFSLPQTVSRADDAQEALYDRCVQDRVDDATRQALATADNPDVQSLMIRMRQKEALAGCRERFPVRMIDIEEPLHVDLFDLRWRF
jgi:hypothetical protein